MFHRLLIRIFTCAVGTLAVSSGADESISLPNILWLTAEDHGPHLGCYGDEFATTPNLDALARKGMIYERAWSVAPVCAPARTAIISGMYPASLGAQHMRSAVPSPAGFKMYPQLLRKLGYYCTNNRKEDYNIAKPGKVWDESSADAHWRNRQSGQPFFAIFNFTETHESQTRKRPYKWQHNPDEVRLPPYWPETPEVRKDWAQYYDQLTVVDGLMAEKLAELEEAGLAEDTIVFYYADHGAGFPRSKRTACDSGLRVPIIIHFPEKWRHLAPAEYEPGGTSQRLVSFVDLAPTLLSLAGQKPPDWMQGLAFAGPHQTAPPKYRFGGRARMDERYDLVRTVTDGHYVYVRNFVLHRPHGQHVEYMFRTSTTQVWRQLFEEGKLNEVQSAFWQRPRAPEELYDLQSDPCEIHNLAVDPAHGSTLERFRKELRHHLVVTRDVCLLPEAEMLSRSDGMSPRDVALAKGSYDVTVLIDAAELAADFDAEDVPRLRELASSEDSGVRYWAAMGMLMRGKEGVGQGRAELRKLLKDASLSVRIAAGEALAIYGEGEDRAAALDELVALADPMQENYYVAVSALNALDSVGNIGARRLSELRKLPRENPNVPSTVRFYSDRLLSHILGKQRK